MPPATPGPWRLRSPGLRRLVPGAPLELADVPITQTTWETPYLEDPFSVPLSEKVDLLIGVTATMQAVPGIALARGDLGFFDINKWFVSSQGHRIHQHLVESGGGFDATAVGESETQRRSYPQSFGQYETGGYEVIRRWDFPANAQRIAEEAAALLSAPEMEEGEKSLILEGSQLALQIHESVGHAIELDRILGWEAAFAGTSHLELAKLNTHRYGSEVMNITADATLPGSLGRSASTTKAPRPSRWTSCATGVGSVCCRVVTRPPSPALPRVAWFAATGSIGSRWCG